MRQFTLCIVAGLLLGGAPRAVGQEQDLGERLRGLEQALHKAMHAAPSVRGLPAVAANGFQLGIFSLSDLVTGIRDYTRPLHEIGNHEENGAHLFSGVAEESVQPFGTIEEVIELVRTSVWPEAWERGGTIVAQGPRLLVYQTPAVVRDVGRFLDQKLRPQAHRCVTVEAEVFDLPLRLYRLLTEGNGPLVSSAARQALMEAFKASTVRRVFAGRVIGLLGQSVLMWHGKQIAVMADADVEVAEGAKTSDPVVDVVQAGGYLWVRAVGTGDHGHLRLNVQVRFDELKQPIERRESRENGVLDMPQVERMGAISALVLPVRSWALIGSGVASDGSMRVVLVRADLLTRKGDRQ